MKIAEASITIKADGFNRLIEYPEMSLINLAHELIELCTPELEIKIPDERFAKFRELASREWVKAPHGTCRKTFEDLFVEKECEKLLRRERDNHAYNVMVHNYSKEVKFLQNTIAELMKDKLKLND